MQENIVLICIGKQIEIGSMYILHYKQETYFFQMKIYIDLYILDAPLVTAAESVVYVASSQYKIAQLQCDVRGFPDTVSWMKDGVPITELHPDATRYMWRREVQEDQGIIEAHFDIAAVRETDYGTYTCKANNTFGSHDATIQLIGE
jgi:hypothetical protein